MWNRIVMCAGVAMFLTACESGPAFNPATGSYSTSRVTIEGVGEERTIASVDSTFFGGNRPLLGRDFVSRDYGRDRTVAILSYGFWIEEFGEQPEVIGSSLEVDDVVRTIVGIMPRGVDVPPGVALWIPREGT